MKPDQPFHVGQLVAFVGDGLWAGDPVRRDDVLVVTAHRNDLSKRSAYVDVLRPADGWRRTVICTYLRALPDDQ